MARDDRAAAAGQRRDALMKQRRIIVSIATSADGYIARRDGGVEWLDRPRPKGNYGMGEFFRSIDTILWGRKTYQMGLELVGESLGVGPEIKNYVFSRRPPKTSPPSVEFVREPVAVFARRLRREPGKDIWMMGGAGLIASFLDAGEIDEFRIHVIPIFIGEGIPLIAPAHRKVPLKLCSERRFPDGVVLLGYEVPRRGAKGSSRRRPIGM
jgi:dihydrofolate reductase